MSAKANIVSISNISDLSDTRTDSKDLHTADSSHSVLRLRENGPELLAESASNAASHGDQACAANDESKDHFSVHNGVVCAGKHLVVDFWDAERLTDLALMESALREAVVAGGATLLHIHLHHFTENDGISGVAVLAESHISVHTWPERGYAAFDVFMCGDAQPQQSIRALERYFSPRRVVQHTILRGAPLEAAESRASGAD